MAIKKIRMRPEGVNNYADVLHPETSADVVKTSDGSNVGQKLTNIESMLSSGVPSLDANGNVPESQLGNVAYLKDFYGRDVKVLDLFSKYYISKYTDMELFSFRTKLGSNRDIKVGEYISGLDMVVTETAGVAASMYESSIEHFYIISSSTAGHNSVFCSTEKYDLTNVDYIDIDSQSSISATRIGVSSDITGITRFDAFIQPSMTWSVKRIDVRNLTGEYYLKFSFAANASQTFYIRGIKFINKFNSLQIYNGVMSLQNSVLSQEVELPQQTIPSHFLDWYNLNALVDTPPNTSVRFDIYDKYDRLLKADVKQGEILKLTEPIIKPKVTLSRNSLTDPSPTFSWMEIGMRGVNGDARVWKKIDEIVLDANTQQIDINLPIECSEFKILCSNMKVLTSPSPLQFFFNNDMITTNYNQHSYRWNATVGVDSGQAGFRVCGQSLLNSGVSSNATIIITNTDRGIIEYNVSKNTHSNQGVGFCSYKDIIKKISFITSASAPFVNGTKFEIWGR